MKVFNCDHCRQLVFFENVQCVGCGHALAFLPDLGLIGSLESVGNNEWMSPIPRVAGRLYRLCENYTKVNVCNWAIPAESEHTLCESCRLTRVIPDLNKPGNHEAWYKLEVAKRRLVYSLLALNLPVVNTEDDPERGLAFEFLADPEDPTAPRVLTGHAEGVITLNIAEADDAERERRRVQMFEPYRTILGHFRHESGHYYWDRMIDGSSRAEAFRSVFGDERLDYSAALKRHYRNGPPLDWRDRFVTSYASAHPWEDWAESWAHYLHMTDTLETAATCGVSLRPARAGNPKMSPPTAPAASAKNGFEDLMSNWFPLTYLLNNLNRGLGLPDGYPFVLSPAVIDKLRFVHETVVGTHTTDNHLNAKPPRS